MEYWLSNAYAKINLGLHILEKLPNGYHSIETGFCFIEWADRFEVKPANRMHVQLSDPSIPVDDTNLVVKAVQILQQEAGLRDEFEISVQKNIPVGAGLGGGSSDAALTLRMLNKIANLGLSDSDLVELGKQLGADVPFFILNEAGMGTGLGTEIEPLPIQPDAWIVTLFPDVFSSTVEAYQYCEPGTSEFSVRSVLLEEDMDQWQYLLQNDLEPAVFPRIELVGNLKDQFYDFGAQYAAMSGSGSSVYGIFEQDFVALNAYDSLHQLGFKANLTRPLFKPDTGIYQKE
ncbi:MAG: 4-(cytidine 5'-diphospho)-2-C-methyl-D-erythritol kinase [Bacteroidota bacterium]